KSVLVGDLKFVVFKHFRANKGLQQVEFAGGALQCGELSRCARLGILTKRGARLLSRLWLGVHCARTSTRSASYFIHNSSCFRGHFFYCTFF
uniref:Uncharacterized protein n=1 Tax=Aegilops tauschii subsp. strangulata TaxID=200361 RepID=A0A453GZN4_AEGTS